jgi:tyrosine-protein kinase
MTLNDFLSVVKARKLLVGLTFAVTLISAFVLILTIAPTYSASATLRIATAAIRSGDGVRFDDITYSDRLMNTYTHLVTSKPLGDMLARRLGVRDAPTISVETPANTEFMQIRAEAATPTLAARAANTAAALLMRQVKELNIQSAQTAERGLTDQIRQLQTELRTKRREYERLTAASPPPVERLRVMLAEIRQNEDTLDLLVRDVEEARVAEAMRANSLSVVEPAVAPGSPSKPQKSMILALALLLGLAGGVGLAFVAQRFDPRPTSSAEIQELARAPILASIPTLRRVRGQRPVLFGSDSPQQEALRRLRIHISRHALKTLVVTSADPMEGKSTVVLNAAAALARTGQSVVVVDGDMRRPCLHDALGVANDVGLSSFLKEQSDLRAAIQETDILGLSVLTSGPPPGSPADLLGSPRMALALAELRNEFDVVLIDTPAFLAVVDGALLAGLASGVVVVVNSVRGRRQAITRMVGELSRMKANVIGVVANRSEAHPTYGHYTRGPLSVVVDDDRDAVRRLG